MTQTEAVALDDEIETLGQAYQDMAVAGQCSDADRVLFLHAGARMVRAHGAEAISLASTDLNLAFDGQDPGYRIVDTLDVHGNLLARLATGETEFPS